MKSVAHGQLASDKIFMTADGPKIFEFGIGKKIDEKSAPEIKDRKDALVSIDVWNLGYLILEMVSGKEIIGNTDISKIEMSEKLKDFVIDLLNEDCKQRITSSEALEHPFIVKSRDSILNRHRRREAKMDLEEEKETELALSPTMGAHSVRTQVTKTTRIGASSVNSPRGLLSNNHSFSFVSGGDQSFFLENLDLQSSKLFSSLESLFQLSISKPESKDNLHIYFVNLKVIIEECDDPSILSLCFRIVVLASDVSHEILEKLCTSGLISAVFAFAGEENEHDHRLAVAYVLKQLFQFDDLIKLSLAAGALEALPLFLDADFENNKDIIFIGIDCMMPLRHNYDSLCV